MRSEDGFTFLVPLVHSIEFSITAENKMQNTYGKYMSSIANSLAVELKDVKNYSKSYDLAKKYGIFKLVFLDRFGKFVYSTKGDWGNIKDEKLLKVCNGELDSYSLGLKKNRYGTLYRFAFVKHIKNGAVILIQEGEELLSDFKELTYKHVFDEVTKYSDILFVIFQTFEDVDYVSDESILKMKFYSKIEEDKEISDSIYSDEPFTRLIGYKGKDALECIYPVYMDGKFRGVIRAGLSLDFVNILRKSSSKNILASILLVLILDIAFIYSMFVTKKRSKEGITFRTVLESLNDGVVIYETEKLILKNNKAEQLLNGDLNFLINNCKLPFEKIIKNGKTLLVLRNILETTVIYIIRDVSIEDIREQSNERERQMLSMGRLSSVFAHEIRNPLNSISMIVQQLDMNQALSVDEKNMISIVDKEMKRLNRIVSEFMEVAKMPEIVKKNISVKDLFKEIKLLYSAKIGKDNIILDFSIGNEVNSILVDLEKFKGVLINLIENSMAANPTNISISAEKKDDFIEISIEDDGDGMDELAKEKAFELYFTTKETGSGLGLPYVQRIVTAHGGLVNLKSENELGTIINILLKDELEEI